MSRNNDPFGYGLEHLTMHRAHPCFECEIPTKGKHHVIPVSLGGTKQIPLCTDCHSIVHGVDLNNSSLIKLGMQKAKDEGKQIGPPIKATEEMIEKVFALRSSGMSHRHIGMLVGLSNGTICKILKSP